MTLMRKPTFTVGLILLGVGLLNSPAQATFNNRTTAELKNDFYNASAGADVQFNIPYAPAAEGSYSILSQAVVESGKVSVDGVCHTSIITPEANTALVQPNGAVAISQNAYVQQWGLPIEAATVYLFVSEGNVVIMDPTGETAIPPNMLMIQFTGTSPGLQPIEKSILEGNPSLSLILKKMDIVSPGAAARSIAGMGFTTEGIDEMWNAPE